MFAHTGNNTPACARMWVHGYIPSTSRARVANRATETQRGLIMVQVVFCDRSGEVVSKLGIDLET